jgi:flavin-dependent dehydrogenase
LPFPAASLTRKALDTALITEAIAAGVRVQRGCGVQTLVRTTSNTWQATLDDGSTYEAPTVFLATGKHDLRGYTRPEDPDRWVGFKMYFRLARTQAAELARASELMLYPGGYGGIQPVEDGNANLCWVIQQRHLAQAGHRWENLLAKMQQDCPHLAMRLAGAEPLLAKPIAITHIPYGFIRRTTDDGLYCIGDQAAVIPSFTGDGISIALHTARCAVAAYHASEAAPLFQAKLRSGIAGPDAPCRVRRRWLEQRTRARCITVLPKSMARRDARNGKSTIQVTGIFTLLGTPHEITVPMQVHLEEGNAAAKAHFVVPYVDWGLKNPSFMIWKAENDVAIDLNLVGTLGT